MNKIYKVVWSKAKHCYVVTSELAKRQTKGCGARSLRMATVSLGVAATLLCSGAVLPIFGDSVAEAAVTVSDASNPTASVGIVEYPLESTLGFKVYTTNSTDKELNIAGSEDNSVSAQNGFVGVFEMASSTESPKGTVNLNSGVTVGAMIGGGSYSGDVANNAVKVTGGTVDIGMFGGFAFNGNATGNAIEISGDSTVINSNAVNGNYDYSKVVGGSGKTGASKNTVTIKGGTINSTVYGGYSEDGVAGGSTAAEGNKVNITGGKINFLVYGGFSNNSNANFNAVTVSGGEFSTVFSSVYGGFSSQGNATNNSVSVSGGSLNDVCGGSGNGNADNNTVTVTGGTMMSVNGGRSVNGTANNNTIDISGGTIGSSDEGGSVVGAYHAGGGAATANNNKINIYKNANIIGNVAGAKDNYGYALASGNTITIDGSAVVTGNVAGVSGWGADKKENKVFIKNGSVTGDVYGGLLDYNAEYKGNLIKNEVNISGGKVTGNIYGGAIKGKVIGDMKENKVNIAGGTLAGGLYYGGYGSSGEISGNQIIIESGTFNNNGTVYGGYTSSSTGSTGAVKNNKVIITGVSTASDLNIYGGYTYSQGDYKAGEVTGNAVEISKGKIKAVIGGYVSVGKAQYSAKADNNTVSISGDAELTSGITCGSSVTIATNNHVNLSGKSKVGGTVYGGYTSHVYTDYESSATGNDVTISENAELGNSVIGGCSQVGKAESNVITIKGGTVKEDSSSLNPFIAMIGNGVYGGFSLGSGNVLKNTVTIEGGTVNAYRGVYGGWAKNGTAGGSSADDGNKVSITGGTVSKSVYGGYGESGAATGNTVTITGGTVNGNVWGGFSKSGDPTKNSVTISGGTFNGQGIVGGYLQNKTGYNGSANENTVTISGGTFGGNVLFVQGGYTLNADNTTNNNTINLTGTVTGLENVSFYGGGSNASNTGNELHVGGIKGGDNGVWQGKTGDIVNNKVKYVGRFDKVVLHSVKWDTKVAALEATTVEKVKTLDIKDLKFDQTPTSGSMALLKSESILGVGGVGIGLAYKDGSTEKTATSAELATATGVTFDSGALVDSAVGGVTLTGTQSKKVSLEDEDKTIMYSFSSSVDGITIATDTFTADGTARTFGKGVTLTGATITNNLAFSDESKKNMASGTSMVILDAIEAVAVSGATLPTFDATTYDVDFSHAIDSKVVTLNGKHTDTLAMNDTTARTQLIYTVGDKNVETATFNGAVDFSTGDAYYTADSQYKFSATNVDAKNLTFNETTEALTKDSSMTLLSATGLTAGTITQPDALTVAINYGGDATNGITFNAVATGSVAVESGAVKFKVNAVEAETIDLSNWNGTTTDVSTATSGWTLKAGETVETGDLAKADLSDLKPGDTKTILTASDSITFTDANITGSKKWQAGGAIDDSSGTTGVKIATGTTTGGGVKVNADNAHQLIYEMSKDSVTAITLGSVAYTKGGTVRAFGNSYDLTNAEITIADSSFSLSNLEAVKDSMNTGDTMVVVDATNAIKADGEATKTLKDFTTVNAGNAIAFTDQIEGKALTLSGTHQDTLEQNEAENQILYKVGDKNVNQAIFTGEVTWNDSEVYYTNDTTKYKFAATNVNAEALIVTGTTTKALKADGSSSMTLLSSENMTATIATDQSATNKTASKVSVNYKDGQGIAFSATAKGAVTTETDTVKYNINEVKLTDVDLSGWTGSESSVPDTWTAEDGSVKVATGSFAEPDVAIGSARTILTAGSAFFADDNISGANKYDEANGKAFSETQNNVTVSGTQAKGVAASEDSKSLVYKVDIKKADTVSLGATNWQKGATLFDGSSATEYDYANVTAVDAGKFDVTYASPETVAAGESMTLLKANETLTAIINEEKAKAYSFSPVSGVTVDAAITGKLANSGNNVVFTAAANQASKLTFGDVEWKDSGALMTRPSNITFASADVDTSKINFTNMIYLDADRQMTLVSDFGDKVGTITGSKYLVGTAFEGEGAASLSGSDLVFRTKTGAGVSEQTHKTVMATEVGVTMLNTGNDYIDKAMEGMGDLANVAPDGTTVGAAIGGDRNRYETGSHVNVNSWNAAVAVGVKRELKNGSLEYGVFGEYGKANFTLHSDAGKGDGDAHYAGGGLLAKWTNKHDVYTEASFRLGRLSESSSDIMRDGLGNTYGYDVHANYYGAHVGVGKIFRYNGGRSLDVYGKYFYTKRDGVEFDAVQHYNLDSVSSSVLRIGARYGTTDKKWNWYGGLAYEYEFDGEAEGVVNGVAIRAASIKGSSVRGEIGLRMNATKTNPWQMDISLYGYGGKHRGFGGSVNVAYTF